MNNIELQKKIFELRTQIVFWQEEAYKAKLETVAANKNILALEKRMIDSGCDISKPGTTSKTDDLPEVQQQEGQ